MAPVTTINHRSNGTSSVLYSNNNPSQLNGGPGITGIKLPIIPTKMQMAPRVVSNISIFNLVFSKLQFLSFYKNEFFPLPLGMRKVFYIGFICLFYNCAWLTPKEELKAQYVADQLKEIDWQSVDLYPLFESCEETLSKSLQKECFEAVIKEQIVRVIQQMYDQDSLSFSGTFSIDFKVNATADIHIQKIEGFKGSINEQKSLEKRVQKGIASLPFLSPAVKQGIPVATRFQIPIEIHLD